MFIIFLLKIALIILTYLTLTVSLAILLQYIKQFFSYLKGMKIEGELSNLKRKAKVIVLTCNLMVMFFSVWGIKMTAEWQMALIEGIRNAAAEQPIVIFMIAFLALYPIIALRKWAMESE